MTVPR